MNNEAVNVHILDREYTIGVEPGERGSLMAAAKLLDTRMREVRGSNKMTAVDRIAVLAALNLAHELQQMRDEQHQRQREFTRIIDDLQHRLDQLPDGTAR
ncbi:cell division protein ZapA [Pseudoxanthomonas composti]|uniref:Cell division protein ZapA n=1 Tax=Pseudoxanthomonas composti TaxID=2137479 RepID=A0A4Q1JTH8_9GAMM|nr:cell division protein ZapA [Pseudoxanthomonas composti]RXR04240.1 cell division protein ZapA [Pseudoxanthomonas composti]